jgi:hypothetical protein
MHTQTQTIAEARELVSFANRTIDALRAAAQRLSDPDFEDERGWLATAERRLEQRLAAVEVTLRGATALPEFAAERQAERQALFDAWVDTVEGLALGISAEVSPNSPLMEVLFPHQKFDKLRRGGAAARTYLGELERRRRTSYVVRLANEPEYAFLARLLGRFDAAKLAFEQQENAPPPSEEQLAELRQTVLQAADDVRHALHQARLLAEAALARHPGWLSELGLDAKPKRRSPKPSVAPPENP